MKIRTKIITAIGGVGIIASTTGFAYSDAQLKAFYRDAQPIAADSYPAVKTAGLAWCSYWKMSRPNWNEPTQFIAGKYLHGNYTAANRIATSAHHHLCPFW